VESGLGAGLGGRLRVGSGAGLGGRLEAGLEEGGSQGKSLEDFFFAGGRFHASDELPA
jgi:hypothetical protein